MTISFLSRIKGKQRLFWWYNQKYAKKKTGSLSAFIRNPKKNQTRMKQIQKYRRFNESRK